MIARIQKSMQEKDKGFTLIELLVVMIIIGILAAIAIPVFLNQRAKARDTAARSDVSTIGKELGSFYVDNAGTAPAITINGTAPNQNYQWTPPGAAAPLTLGATSDNVTGVALGVNNATTGDVWCAQVTYTGGTGTTMAYGSQSGLGAINSTCGATTGLVTNP